jgi:hypothetical protein
MYFVTIALCIQFPGKIYAPFYLSMFIFTKSTMSARQLKKFWLNAVLEENSKSCQTKLVLTVISEL